MPNEKTRADSLREYITGASSDGGAQADPNLSLGNFRSSSLSQDYTATITNPIQYITVDFISGANNPGTGSLTAVDANTLRWADAGGAPGADVTIGDGETKIVEASGRAGAFVRVTRTSPNALTPGTASVEISAKLNNVKGGDTVSSAEALAGVNDYRASIMLNEAAGDVTGYKRWIGELASQAVSNTTQLTSAGSGTIETTGTFADWPQAGWCHIKSDATTTREIVYYSSRTDTVLTVPLTGRARLGTTANGGAATDTLHAVPGLRIAAEPGGVTAGGASIQTIADENTAPAGVTWYTGITDATCVNVGTVQAGQQIGMWYHREIPPEATESTFSEVIVNETFDAA